MAKTFADWIDEKKIPISVIAARIGVSRETIRRYRNGENIPDRDVMPKLYRFTEGVIDANSFYGIDRDKPIKKLR